MAQDEPVKIRCGTDSHGSRPAAVVCVHLLAATDRCVGFVENSSDPDDLQAWCDECETLFAEEQDLTERFRRYNDMKVVCDLCYGAIRARHTAIETTSRES